MITNYSDLLEICKDHHDTLSAIVNHVDEDTICKFLLHECKYDYVLLHAVYTSLENPTERITLVYIRSYGSDFSIIKNPTDKIYWAGLQRSHQCIESIPNPSETMKEYIVRENPTSIGYIKNPSKVLQIFAVKTYPSAIFEIETPCEEAIKIAGRSYNELIWMGGKYEHRYLLRQAFWGNMGL